MDLDSALPPNPNVPTQTVATQKRIFFLVGGLLIFIIFSAVIFF